jgi:hypothetical protein
VAEADLKKRRLDQQPGETQQPDQWDPVDADMQEFTPGILRPDAATGAATYATPPPEAANPAVPANRGRPEVALQLLAEAAPAPNCQDNAQGDTDDWQQQQQTAPSAAPAINLTATADQPLVFSQPAHHAQ